MYQKLLIAIDPEDDGEGKRAMETALELLHDSGELHLASVFQPDSGGFFPHVTEESPEDREARVRERLDLLARKYLPLNRDARLHVLAGTAGEKLVALGGQLCVDLMILVSRGGGSRWPMRKATVEYVAVHANCAVLVLPAIEAKEPEESEG